MNTKDQTEQDGKWLFRLWLIGLVAVAFTITFILAAWATRHSMLDGKRLTEDQRKVVIAVAGFPGQVKGAVSELYALVTGESTVLLIDKNTAEQPHWVRQFPAPSDPGYLLFSGLDPIHKQSVVQLIRVSDGKVIHEWIPDWNYIHRKITDKKWGPRGSVGAYLAVHPLMLNDGSIIFNTGNALVRQSMCSRTPSWVLDGVFHHSIELGADEKSIWVPSVADTFYEDNPYLKQKIRDDSLAQVSLDGQVLQNLSFSKILFDNGLREFLLGRMGLVQLNDDPIHINQISIAPRDTNHWKKGDLLISARHLSSVFLYRPSTNKIIWHQTGPWMNQHAALFVDTEKISIFDNNVYGHDRSRPKETSFVSPKDLNRVFVYDFRSITVIQPYAKLLSGPKPQTVTAGRGQILPDGGLFVEETNFGRHLRFDQKGLVWSRINDFNTEWIGAVSWSRYISEQEFNSTSVFQKDVRCE